MSRTISTERVPLRLEDLRPRSWHLEPTIVALETIFRISASIARVLGGEAAGRSHVVAILDVARSIFTPGKALTAWAVRWAWVAVSSTRPSASA
jgi:hypothetical protein